MGLRQETSWQARLEDLLEEADGADRERTATALVHPAEALARTDHDKQARTTRTEAEELLTPCTDPRAAILREHLRSLP